MDNLPHVQLFTDGACSGNPGPGGWAVILRHGDTEKEMSGGEAHTTNNRMELQAAIQGLKALKQPCRVHLHTDSEYVLKGYTVWLPKWLRTGKKNIKNLDLWQALQTAAKPHHITWEWVRGHAGHPENERVDQLAVKAIPKKSST